MSMRRKGIILLSVVVIICSMCMTAFAHEVPDMFQKGSIRICMHVGELPISGGSITLYRVAAIVEDGGDFEFVLTEDFSGCSVILENIQSSALAKELATYAKEHRIEGTTQAVGKSGEISFTNLELGLYLLVQEKPADDYSKIEPFLASIPMKEGGVYVYDIDAEPKLELKKEPRPEPPSEPVKPSGPTLPQTGQLNWPIPILLMLGLCLYFTGWLLRFGKKDDDYEK